MADKSAAIYGNPMNAGTIKKAQRAKQKFLGEFGDDSARGFFLRDSAIPELTTLGIRNLTVTGDGASPQECIDLAKAPKALVIGTIRMGFGHYRISIAIASAARSMGYQPWLFDLHSFQGTTGSKIISKLNGLYSLGSRLSQKFPLFNALYWEPLNSEGFRKLTYNAVDQKTTELMAAPCALLPRDVPYIATHVWPAQAAVHAGMTRVVNAVPDNWPMALHLSEGALHTVQTSSAWFGYKTLHGMNGNRISKGMTEGSIVNTGHYIDHELVSNLECDTAARLERLEGRKPLRVLLTVGGAGAQQGLFAELVRKLIPRVKSESIALFVNVGDHGQVLEGLKKDIPELQGARLLADDWEETVDFARKAYGDSVSGIYLFCNKSIFSAVYATNLLMRAADLLITKPSELAFYPIPKLHIRRVGGHEAWGAIRSAEIGDGTIECDSVPFAAQMLDLLLDEKEALIMMNNAILAAHRTGIYSGAYRAVELATAVK